MISRKDPLSFDPIDFYKGPLKAEYDKNAAEFLNALVRVANIDEAANRKIVAEINRLKKKIEDTQKTLVGFKFLLALCIFLLVAGVVMAIVGICLDLEILTKILLIAIGAVVAIGMVLLIFLVINKKIKNLNSIFEKHQAAYYQALNRGIAMLNPFRQLLTYKDFIRLVNRTTDVIKLDEELKPQKLLMLHSLYNYNYRYNQNVSVCSVQSGDISSNPFIRVKLFATEMVNFTYVGSRTVTWAETYHSNGRTYTRTVSQTLTATVVKPVPKYYFDSAVIYGNEAAPDLSFTRRPSGVETNSTEKQIDNLVKKGEKQLEKLTEKATKQGRGFQALANSEFDVLFGALNRDNEVQYRLLFTPLAQQNMVEIITSKEPYGDDFYFKKDKKLNIVSTLHGKDMFDYDPSIFNQYYDYDLLKKDFLIYLKNLFGSLYFDLAPILAIPLYQTTDAGLYNPGEILNHVSTLEAESFVNEMAKVADLVFRPQEAAEKLILKVNYQNSVGETDIFDVVAYSYQKIPNVTVVPVMANNGRLYDVAVNWFDFIPVNKTSRVGIRQFDLRDDATLVRDNSQGNEVLQSSIRNKNFVGFYIEEGKEYTQQDDNYFVKYIKDRFVKNK